MSLISNYKVITVTHHTLDVNDIGNFYIQNNASKFKAFQEIKSAFDIVECIYLETCNRVSYILYGDQDINEGFLYKFFKLVNPNLQEDTLLSIKKFVSIYSGESALRHVFELASSMDSLVVGEREIFRQFRTAYKSSQAEGLTGDYMRLLEKFTVESAKNIYNKTQIGEKSLSVVALAIKSFLAKNPAKDSKILLVGSGETNTLVGKFLLKYQFNNISIYNRSIDNASVLSKALSASSHHLKELDQIKGAFDVVFICTSANKIVIDLETYNKMLHQDSSKKILVDLAVPRNISPEVVNGFNVDYIDIESLKTIAEENLIFRKKEIQKARPIIDNQVVKFKIAFQQRHIEKALSFVPQRIHEVKDRAIQEVYKNRLEKLNPEAQDLIKEMLDYMEKKCVSIPMELSKVVKVAERQ